MNTHRGLPARHAQRGFTLIELIVVIVILGLVVVLAVLRIPDRAQPIDTEASRLVASLDLLAQQSIMRGLPQSIAINADGYRLEEFRGGKWLMNQSTGIKPDRYLPEEIHVDVNADSDRAQRRLVLLPSGDVSAEELVLTDIESGRQLYVALNAYGEFEVLE